MRVISLLVLCTLALIESAGTLDAGIARNYQWGLKSSGLEMSLYPVVSNYQSHQPIKFIVAIKNEGTGLRIRRTGDISEYTFTVASSDGSIIAPNPESHGHVYGGSIPNGWNLKPGSVYETNLYLDSIYRLSPGRYRVQAHTLIALEGKTSVYTKLDSNAVIITITP